MCLIHAAGQDNALNTVKDEIVIVTSAKSLGQGSGKTQFFACIDKMFHYRGVFGDILSNETDIRCHFFRCDSFGCRLFKSMG